MPSYIEKSKVVKLRKEFVLKSIVEKHIEEFGIESKKNLLCIDMTIV